MNFDDDEIDFDIGYTPSVAKGSRSASMKKLTRKNQNKPAPKKQEKKNNDFDMLEDLLGPDSPKKKSVQQKKPKNSYDSVDSFFDDPSPTVNLQSKTKKSIKMEEKPKKQQTLTFNEDLIIQESKPTNNPFSFESKKNQSKSLEKPIIDEEPSISISPSLRNMKPPLRKRQSNKESNLSLKKEEPENKNIRKSLGLTLSQEGDDKKSMQSKEKEQSVNTKPGKKRISIENKSQELKLSLDTPTPEPKINKLNLIQKNQLPIQDSIMINEESTYKPNTFKQDNSFKQQKKNEILSKRYPQTLSNPPILPREEKKVEMRDSTLPEERELQFIRGNYQKHIESLQRNLQEQLMANKQSREKLMEECNNLISMERKRLEQLHQQQITRIKEMGDWEKKRMEQNFKLQIERLNRELNQYRDSKQANKKQLEKTMNGQTALDMDKKQIRYQEEKLKIERRGLEQQRKMLDRRQYDLEERERQFLKYKQLQQKKLREQEAKVMKYEQNAKKNIMELKREIENQKHDMAVEIVDLELQAQKKQEKLKDNFLELENEKLNIEKQRGEFRKMNRKIFDDLKDKQHQLQTKQKQLQEIQKDLITKIKIIQARNTQINAQQINAMHTVKHKQNTYLNNDTNLQLKRPLSAHHRKDDQQRKVMETQKRFLDISQNIKQNLKRPNSKECFDLNSYMLSMAKYTRTRQDLH